MISDLLSTHLLNVVADAGYKNIDSISEEEDRYLITTDKGVVLVIRKDNIHMLLETP